MAKQKKNESTHDRYSIPLSESALLGKVDHGTAQECINDIRALANAYPEKAMSRNFYRVHGMFRESVWNQYFGTFHEFKRQAGIVLTRQQHLLEKQIAKHASVDNYKVFNIERQSYAEKYLRESGGRFKVVLVCSDLHDKMCDPFYLRVLVDTAKRVQPDIICINGDLFDNAEFGRYTVDPRIWDVTGRIEFVHENILKPLREACPDAQIDLISGNHEDRIVKHLADATPALKAVLADLHGFTVGKLLGLDKFEINLVAKSDLCAYTATNIKSEIAKNYKVYYGAFLTNHYPTGMKLGMPGTNGHNHKYKATPCSNTMFGAYTWTQTACGHIWDASYCDGEKWELGFLLAHIDSERKATNQEYIAITDFAVVGGKYYTRQADEFVKIAA